MNRILKNCVSAFLLLLLLVSVVSCAAEKSREEIIRELFTDARQYPSGKVEPERVDIINGYRVADPYRWMEAEGAADEWVKEQNSYTDTYLYNYYYDGLEESLEKYFDIGFISSLTVAGDRYFYLKRDDSELEQPNLMILSGNVERVLLDLNSIDPEKKTSLDWFYPSRDGRLLAYGLSKNGSENSTLYIMDVNEKRVLDDQIPNTRHSSLEWLPDKSGFFYTRYPEGDSYNRRAYFHKLGDDWHNDELIFGENKRNATDWTQLRLSLEGDMLAIVEYHGWTDCDLYVYDLLKKRIINLYYDLGAMLNGLEIRGGRIYSLTNMNAPKWKLVSIPTVPAEPGDWQTIIPEGDWPVEFFQIVKDRIVMNRLENVAAKLEVYDLKGQALGNVKLPTFGMIDGFAGEPETNKIAYTFTSFFYPSTMYKADLENAGGEIVSEMTIKVKSDIKPDDYVVQQAQYPSYDGTPVNIFIIHKNRIALDGDNPTLLYGYGGFQISMTPYFSRRAMAWLERGGVYAVAGIRGGGEFGEDWHQAGMLDKKFQVFKDFEYAMRFLHKQGYTRPERLAIEGGSNGGLLIGAMMTGAPYLFAAGVGSVGLYDMVRYHKFPPGELWIGEYGSADNYTDTGFLWGYSPYHQIIKGVKYPAFYGHTADTDTRVNWVHTAKFVAALQAASASNAPILFHRDTGAGHGMGKGKSDATREYIMKMTFMFSIIGDPAQKAQADSDEMK